MKITKLDVIRGGCVAVSLILLAFAGYFGVQKYNLQQKQEMQAEKQSLALREAISLNNYDVVKFLVKNGADLEYRDASVKTVDGVAPNPEGFTALGWAMFTNRPEIARYLIEQGADVKASMPMESMLFWAIAFKMEDIAALIIDKGGDVSGANSYNPAAHAKILGLESVVNKLAEKGISAEKPSTDDFSEPELNKTLEK